MLEQPFDVGAANVELPESRHLHDRKRLHDLLGRGAGDPELAGQMLRVEQLGERLVHEARLARGGNISSKRRALERIQRIEPGRSGLSYSGI
jgi:hypothetical protein